MLNFQNCDFVFAATTPQDLEAFNSALPQVAFWGRSNVGKSSLINAITSRKALARTSKTPGRTQQINFFDINKTLVLADLPGYGHAQAAKADIKQWNRLIRLYLKHSRALRCVMLLIDARHGAMKNDLAMMDFLDEMAVSYQLVLTKADHLKEPDLLAQKETLQTIAKTHGAARPDILISSAETKLGIDDLRTFLWGMAT